MMKKFILFVLSLPILLNSCLLLSSLQDGNTLGKKNVAMTYSLHGAKGAIPSFNPDNEDKDDNTLYKPIFQFSSRFGLSEKFDLGFKLNNADIISLTTKYQLIGSRFSKHGLSTGLDASITGVHIPLYYSYKIDPSASLYINSFFTPTYLQNLTFNTGVILGSGKSRLAIEIGYQKFLNEPSYKKYDGLNGGIGVLYHFGADFKK